MPGSVGNAAPLTTMPVSLSKAFTHSREFPVIDNEYANGESQRSHQSGTSRKSWGMTKELAPAALLELRNFYGARRGPLEAFYFYEHNETDPKYDLTPSGGAGRYTVRFMSPWEQTVGMGRAEVPLAIIELA